MKKYIVIILAAVLALAACTKVKPEEKKADAISFQVASYMTKAQGTNFLAECPYFFTNAWYYPASGDAQNYMPNVKILPDGDAQFDYENDTPETWAPAEPYYWPKSGYLNFFSYASVHDLGNEIDLGNNQTPKGSKITITGHKVVADDNIMIADAVYNASRTAHNADGSMVTDNLPTGTADSQFKGVPTMFRHLLAQVKFNIGLATANPTTGTTNFKAKVTSAKVEKVVNKGTLSLTAGAPQTTGLEVQAWSPASNGNVVGWVASTVATDVEDLTLSNSTVLALPAGESTGNSECFLDFRSVLPQTLGNTIKLTIKYDLQTLHGTTVYIDEKDLEVSAVLNTAKLNATTAISSWCMNKRYTYNITIDPVTEVITFDPAVAEWTYASGTIAL